MGTNRKLFHKKRFWAGILLAQIVLFYLLSFWQPAIRSAEWFFELKKSPHQSLFAALPFSVGDIFYLMFIGIAIFLLASVLKKTKRNDWIKILILINVFYFVYQVFWGLVYFQKPVEDKLPQSEISVAKAKILAEKYLDLCKTERAKMREDRNGVFKVWNLEKVQQSILVGQKQLPKNINSKTPTGISDFKPSIFGAGMSYSGILGYYNPFTAEAQYDAFVPSSSLPFTLAHESSHQLGYAREQEANFIGFLICKNSGNADLEYSADYFALKSLLSYIASEDLGYVKRCIHRYSPAMKRDRLYEKVFIKDHQGMMDAFFSTTNDLFLKSNQQDGSISYSYFTKLLIKYENLK